MLSYIYNVMRLPTVLFLAAIVFLKPHEDILEGCSQLDELIKVSIFQKYKDGMGSMVHAETISERLTALQEHNRSSSVNYNFSAIERVNSSFGQEQGL